MKICPICSAVYPSVLQQCCKCDYEPTSIDGFQAYSPKLAHDSPGFKASYFKELAQLERNSFWFKARNKIIIWALKKYTSNPVCFFEIGCGTGYVLSELVGTFPNTSFTGSEIFIEGLKFAQERLPDVNFIQMDAKKNCFYEEFDTIGCFDVLEHIDDDECVLSEIYKATKPDGFVYITVPQHNWLWSAIDEYACHYRRYNELEIHQKIKAAGFSIVRSTSFVTILLPIMLISRFFQRGSFAFQIDPAIELKVPKVINWIFEFTLLIELMLIKIGINFPLGGSRLIVVKK